ncbi:hypothetical protein BJ875DRAFT_519244 [Amylocarpus encephaloides]|uniref:Uncharacterized protein n=1 Tax=Amylocarpus encephaloides TaxID=45428 RepID=A0A9P7YBL6_9HELO|nr:hypothetical protein BJ875DRAFT_519244 [Amylocarpus encephaloides]
MCNAPVGNLLPPGLGDCRALQSTSTHFNALQLNQYKHNPFQGYPSPSDCPRAERTTHHTQDTCVIEQSNTMSQPHTEPQAITTPRPTNPKVSVHIRGLRAGRDPVNIVIRLSVSLPGSPLATLAVFKELIQICVIDPNDRFGIDAALKPLQDSEMPLLMSAANTLDVDWEENGAVRDGGPVVGNEKFRDSVLDMIEKPGCGHFYTEVLFEEMDQSPAAM